MLKMRKDCLKLHRMNNPVYFEHKGLYRQGFATSKEPDENYCLDFGKGKIVYEGSDLTIVTWGPCSKSKRHLKILMQVSKRFEL